MLLVLTLAQQNIGYAFPAIAQPDTLLVVPNALEDERFATNP
jgi:hypothetical protein